MSGESACSHTVEASVDSWDHVVDPLFVICESSSSAGNVGSGKIYVVSVTVGEASW